MVHGNTVANRNGWKFNGSSASGAYAGLDGFGDFSKVDMSGNYFVRGIDNPDKRTFDFLFVRPKAASKERWAARSFPFFIMSLRIVKTPVIG